MDFTKFVEMLNSKSLFFARVDTFEDNFEGSTTLMNKVLERYKTGAVKGKRKQIRKNCKKGRRLKRKIMLSSISKRKFDVERTAINCWHMCDYESLAMWRLYLSSNEGIAIQTTYDILKECCSKSEYKVIVGAVNYIDFENDHFFGHNGIAPFFHKRNSFDYEKELRAVIHRPYIQKDEDLELINLDNGGLKVEVNIEKLIQRVIISPEAPKWFTELVKQTCEKFDFNFQVEKSSLDASPIY